MALIPPAFLNTVVALGGPANDGTTKYNATGFLYGDPTGVVNDEGAMTYRIVLVTNRHVFEGARDRADTLHARFNKLLEPGTNIYALKLEHASWTVHSDPEADVAVVALSPQALKRDGIEYVFFAGDQHSLTLEQACSAGVSEGDGVFVLGFPLGQAGDERNYTIVRQGIVARAQNWLRGDSRTFLIDASVFPGNSGGPVLLKPEATSIQGTHSISRCSLIGMVSSYLPYQEVAVSQQTGRPRMIFEENSGLSRVVPIDVIQEAIATAVAKLRPTGEAASGTS